MARYSRPKTYYSLNRPFNSGMPVQEGSHYDSGNELVGWWRFDTDVSVSGNTTDAAKGNAAQYTGAATRPSFPSPDAVTPSVEIQNNTCRFDGTSDYAYVANPSDDSYTFGDGTADSPMSIMIRFRMRSILGAGGTYELVNKEDEYRFYIQRDGATDNYYFRFYAYDNSSGADSLLITQRFTLTPAQAVATWHMVVFSWDGQKGPGASSTHPFGMKVYHNGSELVPYARQGHSNYVAMEPVGENLLFGVYSNLSLYHFNGNIAEVALWNKALSSEEASAIYNMQRSGLSGEAYLVARDFDVKGTTATLSSSVAPFIQGVNVNSFARFGATITPLLARSSVPNLWKSSSLDGEFRINNRDRDFFDDSFSYERKWPSESNGKSDIEVGDDTFRISSTPSYFRESRAYGYGKLWSDKDPFSPIDSWDSVLYMDEPDEMRYPVVLENPSAIDPFNYDGVIEPFPIRKVIAETSTFIGNIEDPEPQGIRGGVAGSGLQAGQFGQAFPTSNFFSRKNDSQGVAFEPVNDDSMFGGMQDWVKPFPYTTSVTSAIEPFKEYDTAQEMFKPIDVAEMYMYPQVTSTAVNYDLTKQWCAGSSSLDPTTFYSANESLQAWWNFSPGPLSQSDGVDTTTRLVTSTVVDQSGNGNTATWEDVPLFVNEILFSYSQLVSVDPELVKMVSGTPSNIISSGSVFTPGPGYNNGQFSFGADGVVSAPTNLSFGNGTTDKPFSVSFWLNWQVRSNSYYTYIDTDILQFGRSSATYEWRVISSNGELYLYCYDAAYGSTGAYRRIYTDTDALRNTNGSPGLEPYGGGGWTWLHVMVTYDGSGFSSNVNDTAGVNFYVNGTKQSKLLGYGVGTYTAMNALGGDFVILSDDADGWGTLALQDIAVWNKEFTEKEVKALYKVASDGAFKVEIKFLRSELDGRPSFSSRSATCGFEYNNSETGIESLAYGGLKK